LNNLGITKKTISFKSYNPTYNKQINMATSFNTVETIGGKNPQRTKKVYRKLKDILNGNSSMLFKVDSGCNIINLIFLPHIP
jgi:hypothetical protein